MGLLPTSTPKQSTTNNNNAKSRSSQHPSIASASGNQKSNRLYTKAVYPNLTPSKPRNNGKGVTDSLAICLFGYSSHRMYDSEYEEEVRKQAVMQVRRGHSPGGKEKEVLMRPVGGVAGCHYVEEVGSDGSSLKARKGLVSDSRTSAPVHCT